MSGAAEIRLPVFANGRRYACEDLPESQTLEYECGLRVRIPCIGEDVFCEITRRREELLEDLIRLTIDDVAEFFSDFAKLWMDPKYEVRLQAEERAARLTGYARHMIAMDYSLLGEALTHRGYTCDFVESELGNERAMDEWAHLHSSYIRAYPAGVVLHNMVGNMPLANSFSIIWGCLTRNINIAKIPVRDPVTPLALAETFHRVDPGHPLTKSLTVAYWPHESPLADAAYRVANVVCSWGGTAALKRVKEKVPAGVQLVDFGPKWSLAVIDLDRCDPEMAARRMAADVSFYDQEACLSPQRLFIKGPLDKWIEPLKRHLDTASGCIPKECWNRDALAHCAITKLEAMYRGWRVYSGKDWTLMVVSDPAAVKEHPLGRTLFIHPVERISDVARYLTPQTQVVSCLPWELGVEHREEWAAAGAVRVVELGMSRRPQPGAVHDGLRPLTRLVRWVSHEEGAHGSNKYGNDDRDYPQEFADDMLFFRR